MKKRRNLKSLLRYIYLKLLRFKDPPEKIALSFSIGVFIGIFPTFGVGGILVILISYIFKLNYLAGLLGTFIMNYFTSPLFWALSYFVGDFILTGKFEWRGFERGSFKVFAISYLLGNFIVSTAFSVISYLVVKKIVTTYRKKRGGHKPSSS
jgi:uncharacterized protein (DUF2062 family)